jgi:hypothetical protein
MNNSAKSKSEIINERIAACMAKQIIGAQQLLATRLNNWFNAFSGLQKKWILGIVGLILSAMLLAGLSGSEIPKLKQANYSSAHIGQASGIPEPHLHNKQLTDSITIKIRSWKQKK